MKLNIRDNKNRTAEEDVDEKEEEELNKKRATMKTKTGKKTKSGKDTKFKFPSTLAVFKLSL